MTNHPEYNMRAMIHFGEREYETYRDELKKHLIPLLIYPLIPYFTYLFVSHLLRHPSVAGMNSATDELT